MKQETSGAQAAPELPSFDFPSFGHVYAIAPDATDLDLRTMMDTKLAHLDALLALTYGEGGLGFADSGGSGKVVDEYLWACSTLASECRELFSQIEARRAA